MKTTWNRPDFMLWTFGAILENSVDLIFVKDTALRYVAASRCFAHLVGHADGEALIGKTDHDIFSPALAAAYTSDDRRILESGQPQIEKLEHLPIQDGRVRYSSTSKHLIHDPTGLLVGIYGLGRDVTAQIELIEERERREHFMEQAARDPLTGLYNREGLRVQITRVLKEAPTKKHALLFLDLDHFKEINDTRGHLFGDRVLCTLANQLCRTFCGDELIGRIGGDEFLIFLPAFSDEESLRARALSIIAAVSTERLDAQGETLITCSVGISIYQGDGKGLDILQDEADQAMYCAKRQGRNQLAFYHST